MSTEQQITIDGNPYSFESGETILQVAARNGINIPTLCYLKGTTPTGACRMCLVEVAGARSLVASCANPAAPGMVVKSASERVVKFRRMNLQLLLSSGNHYCVTCEADGNCQLQNLAYEYKIDKLEYQEAPQKHPVEINTLITRDFSRCIMCGACVQACNEVQVNQVISCGYRGVASKIVATGDRSYADSDCVFCGECVRVCPVGALIETQSRFKGKARDLQKVKTTCSYCGVGCQLYLHVKNGKVAKVTGSETDAPNYGSLCVKGRFAYDFIHDDKRLTTPLIKENGAFREASWEEALGLIASKLAAIKKESGPDSIGVLASARITNEDNYVIQKFARAVIGTNNVDHCARLCHSSTVAGLAAAFGSGAMTNPIADISKSDVILITGSNTTENHPVLSSYVKRAVTQEGKKLIVIDPRRIPITRHATLWLRQNLGTDVAWINCMMQVIIREGLYDKNFVETRTTGFDALKKSVEQYTPAYIEKITGIPADLIASAARMYAGGQPSSILYAMGITQHVTGTDNVKALANLAMLCGNLGKEGGGVNPLRGQNNVQGCCDMGCLPNVFSGYQKVDSTEAQEKFAKAWGAELSAKPGLPATEMMNRAHQGDLKALYIVGENPMVTDPDLSHAHKSFDKLDLLVVQDIFMTETAQLADVVLPSASFAEKDGTFTNTERKVQLVRKAVNAPGMAREDWQIVANLAATMGYDMKYPSAEKILDEIASLTPSYGGITRDRLQAGGLVWPCPNPNHPGTPRLHVDKFTHGLGIFHVTDYLPPAEIADASFPIYLTTGRVLYQYHSGTMTMKSPGVHELEPECFVEMAGQDAQAWGINDNEKIKIISRRGSIEALARISDQAVQGTVFIPFHYAQAAANRLTNGALDPTAKIPEYKVCAVRIEK